MGYGKPLLDVKTILMNEFSSSNSNYYYGICYGFETLPFSHAVSQKGYGTRVISDPFKFPIISDFTSA